VVQIFLRSIKLSLNRKTVITNLREFSDLFRHLKQIMYTLINPTTLINRPADFVSSDTAALASHMDHCASKRSRFFGVHAALEMVHTAVFNRMVTAAVLAVVLLVLIGIV
jgi:hypothetical protein